MGSHVCDCGGLLGGVGRCSGGWSGRLPSSCTRISASTSYCVANVQVVRREGARLVDGGLHSVVARNGVLEDGENVLGTVGRPRRDHATIVNAEGLRRGGHGRSVGPGWLRAGPCQTDLGPGSAGDGDSYGLGTRGRSGTGGGYRRSAWGTGSAGASPPDGAHDHGESDR